MNLRLIFVSTLLITAPFGAVAQAPPSLPPELDRIVTQHARQRADAITRLNASTVKALDALKVQYMRNANLDAANKTQAKLGELNAEIQGLANQATPPLGVQPQLQTALYTDAHEGSAGNANVTKRNTYEFDVKMAGNAKILVDAPKPGDSRGEVTLKKKGEKTVVLGTWDSTKESGWPLQYETQITKPGPYEVQFNFRSGRNHLTILAVKIDMRTQ